MSTPNAPLYRLLAELLDYPTPSLPEAARQAISCARERCPDAAPALVTFERHVSGRDVRDLEEGYAAVFDFSPARSLDLGYQLFGETYKRGVFLVKMKEAVRAHDIDPGAELPDHLPVVLRLLGSLFPEEEPGALVEEVILPTVEKVLRSFEDDAGGYRSALSAVKAALMADFAITHVEPPRPAEGPATTGRKLPVFPGFDPPTERAMS